MHLFRPLLRRTVVQEQTGSDCRSAAAGIRDHTRTDRQKRTAKALPQARRVLVHVQSHTVYIDAETFIVTSHTRVRVRSPVALTVTRDAVGHTALQLDQSDQSDQPPSIAIAEPVHMASRQVETSTRTHVASPVTLTQPAVAAAQSITTTTRHSAQTLLK